MNKTHVVEGYVRASRVIRSYDDKPPVFESEVVLPNKNEWAAEKVTIEGEYPILTKVRITLEILPESLRRQLGVPEVPQLPEQISN